MLTAINEVLRSRFQDWLERRLPRERTITLNQARVFIFPSRAGWGFIGMLAILLLVAINYQNNMVFALVFLLASVFVITILHTFANLSGLSITALRALPVFAGDAAKFDIRVTRDSPRAYYDIALSWPGREVVYVSLIEEASVEVQLHLPARRRGRLCPDRLLVETFYPLGLLRCWTWLALDMEALVYPRPVKGELHVVQTDASDEGEVHLSAGVGSDDFYAFRDYQPGDPLKHIAWKSFAKGQALKTKQFAAYRDRQLWLDWDGVSGDREVRLSILCYWVLRMEQQREDYGLRLPRLEIAPHQGEQHRDRVLRELALFELPPVAVG